MSDPPAPPPSSPHADADAAEVDRALGVVLDELITAIQETTQAEWSTSEPERRRALDALHRFLVEQATEIANAEARIGGRSPFVVSPSGRRPPNIAGQAHGDQSALWGLLVAELQELHGDVRELARQVAGHAETQLLVRLADGLEEHLAALRP
jgi:hypothetical protein